MELKYLIQTHAKTNEDKVALEAAMNELLQRYVPTATVDMGSFNRIAYRASERSITERHEFVLHCNDKCKLDVYCDVYIESAIVEKTDDHTKVKLHIQLCDVTTSYVGRGTTRVDYNGASDTTFIATYPK